MSNVSDDSNLRLTNPEQHDRTLWNLKWENLSYKVSIKKEVDNPLKAVFKKKEVTWKEIIHGVAGEVKAGEVVAIMGGSGAGKSTLLNTLAGRLASGELTGKITINGKKRDASWMRLAAYVEQEDIMYRTLTVKETVTFAAMLKLPSTMTTEQKLHNVDATLAMLGLQPIADTRIGDSEHRGISGGERKRVSIGTYRKLLYHR